MDDPTDDDGRTVLIRFNPSANLNKILQAEELLREAGVKFDTGTKLTGDDGAQREWFFDWSLQGAAVYGHPKPDEVDDGDD